MSLLPILSTIYLRTTMQIEKKYKKTFNSSFENIFTSYEIDVEYKDFIGIYHRALHKDYCDKLIDIFEKNNDKMHINQPDRNDFAVFLNFTENKNLSFVKSFLSLCFEDYVKNTYFLKNYSLLNSRLKLQKTIPFGGFHNWHFEHCKEVPERTVAWMIYLNDLPPKEGTTEFLYQCKQTDAEQGTVLFWPAGYTHVHRGNPPHTSNKYIATGWYTCCSADNPYREKFLD